jgi:hypothetical protein
MHAFSRRLVPVAVSLAAIATTPFARGEMGTGQVRHAPEIKGRVTGAVQQSLAEDITLTGDAAVTELLVPGTPSKVVRGHASLGATIVGSGSAAPAGYRVTLEGNAALERLHTQVEAVPLPPVALPATPGGMRDVAISGTDHAAVDFAEVRNLTWTGSAGTLTVPPGAYGTFVVDGAGSLTLGHDGVTGIAAYSFQRLIVRGGAELRVTSPVALTFGAGLESSAQIGNSQHPEWLHLRFSEGGLLLRGGAACFGYVVAPFGSVSLDGHSQLTGGIASDRFTVGGGARVSLIAERSSLPPPSFDLPYTTDFEASEGYTVSSLAGQRGWTVAQGAAAVTGQDSVSGLQSVIAESSSPPAQLSRSFNRSAGQTVIFVDFFAKPVADVHVEVASLFESESARMAFVADGAKGVIQVFDGNGTGGGVWRATKASKPIGADGRSLNWVRLTLRQDYVSKRWDLYVDGAMVAGNLNFRDSTQTSFTFFSLKGHVTTATRFDYFYAAAESPLFVDADNDGIDDAYELANGLNTQVNDRDGDLDHDGLTNLQEYVAGTRANLPDTDADGMPDGWEVKYGLNPTLNDAAADADGDGVGNFEEYLFGRNPSKGALPDTTGAVNLRVFQPRT